MFFGVEVVICFMVSIGILGCVGVGVIFNLSKRIIMCRDLMVGLGF